MKSKPLTSSSKGKMPNAQKLKEKLDAIFSKYIRLKYAHPSGICFCISCGKPHDWKKIQNGHYMSRRYMSTRYSEDNCRPQCVACNVFNQGNIQAYRKNLIKEIGEERVDMIEFRARSETRKFTVFDLQELIKYYTSKVKELKESKGL